LTHNIIVCDKGGCIAQINIKWLNGAFLFRDAFVDKVIEDLTVYYNELKDNPQQIQKTNKTNEKPSKIKIKLPSCAF
jgi:hypothetical protein